MLYLMISIFVLVYIYINLNLMVHVKFKSSIKNSNKILNYSFVGYVIFTQTESLEDSITQYRKVYNGLRKHGETHLINLSFTNKDDWDLISKYNVKQIPAIYRLKKKNSEFVCLFDGDKDTTKKCLKGLESN